MLRALCLAVVLLAVPCAVAQAIEVKSLFPAGAQRGQSIDVTATGTFPVWPVQVWTDRPGLTIEPAKDNGKLKISVAADANVGVFWLRFYDPTGASALRPFVVGTLPEVN